jgi:hypothetical protein
MAGRIEYDIQTLVYAETGTFYFAATSGVSRCRAACRVVVEDQYPTGSETPSLFGCGYAAL